MRGQIGAMSPLLRASGEIVPPLPLGSNEVFEWRPGQPFEPQGRQDCEWASNDDHCDRANNDLAREGPAQRTASNDALATVNLDPRPSFLDHDRILKRGQPSEQPRCERPVGARSRPPAQRFYLNTSRLPSEREAERNAPWRARESRKASNPRSPHGLRRGYAKWPTLQGFGPPRCARKPPTRHNVSLGNPHEGFWRR